MLKQAKNSKNPLLNIWYKFEIIIGKLQIVFDVMILLKLNLKIAYELYRIKEAYNIKYTNNHYY